MLNKKDQNLELGLTDEQLDDVNGGGIYVTGTDPQQKFKLRDIPMRCYASLSCGWVGTALEVVSSSGVENPFLGRCPKCGSRDIGLRR